MTEITEGSKAPSFDMPTEGGTRATLSGPTVIFFYPKADTPACTNEAIDFSSLASDFAALGVTVIGVSRDPVKKLDKFKAKHELNVVLASDEAETVTEAYGVWVEKSLYGRQYMGVERATFLIDGGGLVRRIWRKVSVKGHAAEVLHSAQSLHS